MKKTFVLDETVTNALRRRNRDAENLLVTIYKQCHKIAIDLAHYDAYWKDLKLSKKQRGGTLDQSIHKLWGLLAHHAEKCQLEAMADSEGDIPVKHQKDAFLVRIAQRVRQGQVLIVTDDDQTRRDINARTEYPALTVRESIKHARQNAS